MASTFYLTQCHRGLLLLQQLARVQGQDEQAGGDREGGQLVPPSCHPATALAVAAVRLPRHKFVHVSRT
ncbi:hypothetical protein O3P69_012614 [Scylla paramamosain]|uniref:Secreted protein n=1 Tax=Scylla paramamosain TaxID=85552 RepID=A0AAW0SFE9_SCYPA